MTAVALPTSLFPLRDENVMDTRTPSPLSRLPSTVSSAEEYKPDLSAEVAMLSTKLVNAINYQTNLDDSLQQTRHELSQSQQELARVKSQKKQLDDMISSGILVRASEFERRMFEMRSQLALERTARETAEKAKKQTEAELENLTVSLFEEANTMVAAARRETESSEKRNSQLRKELDDTELLLASQQEQLQDLKNTLETLERSTEHEAAGTRENSIPSTPVNPVMTAFDSFNFLPGANGTLDRSPEPPLHFSQLLQPVMRTDVAAYNEFLELMSIARIYRVQPHSRNGSNHTAISTSSQTNLSSTITSSPSLPGAFSFTGSSPQIAHQQPAGPTLKESKFYKRTLVEDLEPTLRLDLAPGLSFISRRTVMSAILQGNLVVEPFLQQAKFQGPLFACGLCGEARKNEPYVRKHRFRTSEEESAQRYPLCDYCLGRLRTTGDFVGFLRMIRDGHWRCDSEEEQKSAWEESVRLRERMFWTRLGGGVVPAAFVVRNQVASNGSVADRPSLDSIAESESIHSNPILTVQDVSARPARQIAVGTLPITPPMRSPAVQIKTQDTTQPTPEATETHSSKDDDNDNHTAAESSSTPYEDAEEDSTSYAFPSDAEHAANANVETSNEIAAANSNSSTQIATASNHTRSTEEAQRDENSSEPEVILSTEKDIAVDSKLTATASARSSVSSEKAASLAQKGAGVLARVRAMEAKAQIASQNERQSNGSNPS